MTGAGKTTFVSRVTGDTTLVIDDGVDSGMSISHVVLPSFHQRSEQMETVTEKPVSITCTIDGKSVTLIDTPGFDDSLRTEVDILKLVSHHLMETYREGTKLNGVVFLQPINQPRVGAAEAGRTRLFKKLLGEQAFRRVVIGGTMWTNLKEAERRIALRKERDDIWGDMIKGGAAVVPYDNSCEGATNIVRSLMKLRPGDLLIQRELASGKKLEDTAAGKELDKQKGEEIAALTEKLRRVELDKESTAAEVRELRDKIYQREEEIMELKRGC